MQLAVLTYAYVPDVVERREPHRAAHLLLIERMSAEGRLLIAGAVGDPPEGALLVFRDASAAEEFAAADPYRDAGLVVEHSVRPWNVVTHSPLEG